MEIFHSSGLKVTTMKNKYSIYKHTLPNGKVYIGCTSKVPEERWRKGCGYFKNKPFYQDIFFYGWSNIKHEIIKEKMSRTEAFELEHKLIMEHRSYMKEYGYNVSTGFGKTGLENKHSEATKRKISISRKNKRTRENHPMAKPVYCVELDKVFTYAKQAEEETGVSRSHICQVCKGTRKTAGKMHWEYYK